MKDLKHTKGEWSVIMTMKQLTNREKKAILHRVERDLRVNDGVELCASISWKYRITTGDAYSWLIDRDQLLMQQFEVIFKYNRGPANHWFGKLKTKIGNKLRRAVVAAEIDRLHKLIREEERE